LRGGSHSTTQQAHAQACPAHTCGSSPAPPPSVAAARLHEHAGRPTPTQTQRAGIFALQCHSRLIGDRSGRLSSPLEAEAGTAGAQTRLPTLQQLARAAWARGFERAAPTPGSTSEYCDISQSTRTPDHNRDTALALAHLWQLQRARHDHAHGQVPSVAAGGQAWVVAPHLRARGSPQTHSSIISVLAGGRTWPRARAPRAWGHG